MNICAGEKYFLAKVLVQKYQLLQLETINQRYGPSCTSKSNHK